MRHVSSTFHMRNTKRFIRHATNVHPIKIQKYIRDGDTTTYIYMLSVVVDAAAVVTVVVTATVVMFAGGTVSCTINKK